MGRLKILDASRQEAFEVFLKTLRLRGGGENTEIEDRVRTILQEVAAEGDRAVRRYTERFDGVRPRSFRLSSARIRRLSRGARPEVVRSLERCAGRITAFHERQKESSWFFHEDGALLGQLVRPLERVGLYVPGGKAAYPSSVLMNAIPARVAGVDEVIMCVPMPGGQINPHVMVAAEMAGVDRIYGIGGAQAVGAMAYGTKSVPRVDKIVGPGNIYVATAKRLVFGRVDIDMVFGPSEIVVIADDSADPAFVAADMLGQAEHDELASAVLVTPSRTLVRKVARELDRQLAGFDRRGIASKSLENFGAAVLTRSLDEAVSAANRLSPEHLEVMTEKPMDLLPKLRNAGAIFLGPWTPEALGDYAAGPNHTLPTGGTARFFSPLGVYDFVTRTSLLSFTPESFSGLSGTVRTVAEAEGLPGHAASVRIRRQSLSRRKAR